MPKDTRPDYAQNETPYSVITWQFDMTSRDGREAFRSAIEGEYLGYAVLDLVQEMRQTVEYNAEPCVRENDEGVGLYNDTVVITTEHWCERLIALMHYYDVTLEV